MIEETVIYEYSGVTLNNEKLYKRVVLEKSITITESKFDEAIAKCGVAEFRLEKLKELLGF